MSRNVGNSWESIPGQFDTLTGHTQVQKDNTVDANMTRTQSKNGDLLELQDGIIYGPLHSRRLGRSLGVNLLSSHRKICSMDCCYCQYGWTDVQTNSATGYNQYFPSTQEVMLAVRAALNGPEKFDYLTFCGNGEPTLHPEFPVIVDLILAMIAFLRLDVKTAILSNSTTCNKPGVRDALRKIHLPIMKLDVGNQDSFARLNRCRSSVSFDEIVSGLQSLQHCMIQSMFVTGSVDNSAPAEVASWLTVLQDIAPVGVQVYSLDRQPASGGLRKVPRNRLNEIAALVRKQAGLAVEVY